MLISVKKLDYEQAYAYAPPIMDAVINTDYIVSVVPAETRRPEPCVYIIFNMGSGPTLDMYCIGKPEYFLTPKT